ncbi:MAG: ribbon-helix-helix protein, CopG family [Rhodoglobus sp.]
MTARAGYDNRDVAVHFRLNKDTLTLLDKIAKREAHTRSEVIRSLLDKALVDERKATP